MKIRSALSVVLVLAMGMVGGIAQAARSDQDKVTYFSQKVSTYTEDAKDLHLIMNTFGVATGAGLVVWAAVDPNMASTRGTWIGLGAGLAAVSVYSFFQTSALQDQFEVLDQTLKGKESVAYKAGALETYMKTTSEWMRSNREINAIAMSGLGAGLLIGGAVAGSSASATNTTAMYVGGAFVLGGILSLFTKSPPEKEWESYQEWLAGKDVKKAEVQSAPAVFVNAIPGGLSGGVQIQM